MRPALEKVDCPRCGSAESRERYTARDYLYDVPGEFHVASCNGCGLWFQNPRPTDQSLTLLYPGNYAPHDSPMIESGAGSLLRRLVRSINPIRAWHARTGLSPEYVPDGRLLELGCAGGARLLALRRQGWQHLYGVDLSADAVRRAQAHGLNVRCGRLEDALREFSDAHFDVVISSMVLEHLFNPFAVIRETARVLRPGGQFLFSTIVRDSLDLRIYGKYWAGFDLPRHMVYFSTEDLRETLHDDFSDVEWLRQVAPIDYVRSASWRSVERKTLLDRSVLLLGNSLVAQSIFLILAWSNVGCRVSFRCRRRTADPRRISDRV